MDVIFEIYEFAMDVIFGTDMQSWNLPVNTIELGRSFQGIGLRDTMSDLIFDTIGALSIAIICFFLYKKDKKKTLKLMHEVFPDK
jgi:VanZ family protein